MIHIKELYYSIFKQSIYSRWELLNIKKQVRLFRMKEARRIYNSNGIGYDRMKAICHLLDIENEPYNYNLIKKIALSDLSNLPDLATRIPLR